jgi:aryl-alcohol dehydrogenase-like predicted oxidoreductase
VEYAVLGGELRVSRIAMGCEPLGGTDWGTIDPELAAAAVLAAIDAGVNFLDTADVYGLGHSEVRLAQVLGQRRHDVVIASKVGIRWDSPVAGGRARTYRDGSPAYLEAAVNASLRRLAIDTLPLLYLHWPDPATPLADTITALDRIKRHGKIRHLAVSNFNSDQIREAHRITALAAVQVEYNFLNRRAAREVLPVCAELGIPVVAYGPLAQGLLSGKFTADSRFTSDDRRHRLLHFQGAEIDASLKTVDALRAAGQSQNRTPAQAALRWVLETPGIACAVAGAKTPEQARENASAAAGENDSRIREHRELYGRI